MGHVPILRHGSPYRSLDTRELLDPTTGATLAVSLANPGLVRRDARTDPPASPSPATLASALSAAADALRAPLRMDPDEPPMTLDRYRALVQYTMGLPLDVIDHQLDLLSEALADLGEHAETLEPAPIRRLAVVLPSNAIAVNRAWLPAVALGAAVALKPGAKDPFTPHRLVAALVASGLPASLFSVYPSDHAATAALMSAWPRVQLFGDDQVVTRHQDDPRVQVNGPGRSAVVLGEDVDWRQHLEAMADGIQRHAGRSCLCTSTIVTLAGGETARALADALSETCGEGVARCVEPIDPLARTERPVPFVGIVAVDARALPTWLGHRLSVATFGVDEALVEAIRATGTVERLATDALHSVDTSTTALHLERMKALLR